MRLSRSVLRRWPLVVPATILAAGALAVGTSALGPGDEVAAAPSVSVPPAPGGSASEPLATVSYADAVSRALPAVVTVRVERRAEAQPAVALPDDPFFRRFFPEIPARPDGDAPTIAGLGSGVLVSSDGTILTNHHVVDGATRLTVGLSDGRELPATVVGSDQPTDLAVLDVEGTDLPALTLANSDRVRVGDVVLAVGNPLGVGQTVTMGIISATDRTTGQADGSYEDFLQTDAPINRGNSGGALITTGGELVGINSQILSPSGGNIGIGFAIPSNLAHHVMTELVAHGRVQRGLLGVTVQPVTAAIAESLALDSVHGAIVASVQPDGPGDRAGLQPGDVITRVNGNPVDDSNDLRNRIGGMAPGSAVTIDVLRDGESQAVTATLDEASGTASDTRAPAGTNDNLGLSLEPLSPELAGRLGMPRGSAGVVVTDVASGSPASAAGLRAGDVIRQANGEDVDTPEEARAAFEDSGGRPVLLMVVRDGQNLFVAVRPS